MTSSRVCYDHIILLLDTATFENIPSWLSDNFNIIEGGTHALGSSRNKLIVFKDGTYIELFNWISEPKEMKFWGDKTPGLIDMAFTTAPPSTAEDNYNFLVSKVGAENGDGQLGVSFDKPIDGGRKRKDGIELKWQITRPAYHRTTNTPDNTHYPGQRTDTPFFTHDVTDRSLRVPALDESITTHPCGAIALTNVKFVVPDEQADLYTSKLYASIIGSDPETGKTDNHDRLCATFEIGVPNPQGYRPRLSVYAASALPDGQQWLRERGIGIYEITIANKEGIQHVSQLVPLASEGIGKSIVLQT